ncbi:MAG: hypothetical protein K0U37_00990 [Gammaproteobacteria bacterium]|nr:hypothetical protein [Gammaproteobacteria bacterium]
MPSSYDYSAIQTHQTALLNVQKKWDENHSSENKGLAFMIEENELLLRALNRLNQYSGRYSQTAFDNFYTKNLAPHKKENGCFDIHQLTQALNDSLKNNKEDFKKLQESYQFWGNIYLGTSIIAWLGLMLLSVLLTIQIPAWLTLIGSITISYEAVFLPSLLELDSPALTFFISLSLIGYSIEMLSIGMNPLFLALILPVLSLAIPYSRSLKQESKEVDDDLVQPQNNPYLLSKSDFFAQPDMSRPSLADEVQAEFEQLSLSK